MRTLLTDLLTAGIRSITLDPVAGKIRWVATQPVPAALRARVASLKPDLLALVAREHDAAESVSYTPEALWWLAQPHTTYSADDLRVVYNAESGHWLLMTPNGGNVAAMATRVRAEMSLKEWRAGEAHIAGKTQPITAPTPPTPANELPPGYTITMPWQRPAYRLSGPDGFWTVATSEDRAIAMAHLHIARKKEG